MISKNKRAEKILGKRIIGQIEIDRNFDYKCPICEGEVQLSEYNEFMWCPICNLDIPEVFCCKIYGKEHSKILIDKFLNFVENVKRNPSLSNFAEDMYAKTLLANLIANILNQSENKEMEFRRFRFLLYKIYKDLKEEGINVKLPHYWFIDGPHVWLKGLPAVFKLRIKKDNKNPKIYKVTILLDKRINLKAI